VAGVSLQMDVERTSECSEDCDHHQPRAAVPGVNAERANGASRSRAQPADGLDERTLQKAEESLEAIRHE
jgi:hypothetical protein